MMLQDTSTWLAWVNYLAYVDAERIGVGSGMDPETVHNVITWSCGRTHTSDWLPQYTAGNTTQDLAASAAEAGQLSVLKDNLNLPFTQQLMDTTLSGRANSLNLSVDPAKLKLACDLEPLEIPQISLQKIQQLDKDELKAMKAAWMQYGCFFLNTEAAAGDHTLSQAAQKQATAFFERSDEFKNQFGHDAQLVYPQTCRGYGGAGLETLHPDEGPCHKEIFDLGLEAPAEADPQSTPFTGPNVLPSAEQLDGFKQIMLSFQEYKHDHIIMPLGRAIDAAHETEGSEQSIVSSMSPPTLLERLIYYPKGQAAFAGRHTDNGLFTVLYFDGTPPQVLYKGRWKQLVQKRCGLSMPLVQIGDMYEWWASETTEDGKTVSKYKAAPHRVQIGACDEKARIAMADFVYANAAASAPIVSVGGQTMHTGDHMLQNFVNIWETKQGAGAALEL